MSGKTAQKVSATFLLICASNALANPLERAQADAISGLNRFYFLQTQNPKMKDVDFRQAYQMTVEKPDEARAHVFRKVGEEAQIGAVGQAWKKEMDDSNFNAQKAQINSPETEAFLAQKAQARPEEKKRDREALHSRLKGLPTDPSPAGAPDPKLTRRQKEVVPDRSPASPSVVIDGSQFPREMEFRRGNASP